MKATLFDYGAGNLFSLVRALEVVGVTPTIEADPVACTRTNDLLVLPGVGAFGHAAARLAPARTLLAEQLSRGRPCLGICLGMQLLFETSEEGGGQGLGVIAGPVTRLRTPRCPHIGWSKVGDDDFYFAHSFACRPAEASVVRSTTEFEGERFASIVRWQRTVGVQFHPEKSSKVGLALLGTLVREVTS
jgi:glutamine amidotransferase